MKPTPRDPDFDARDDDVTPEADTTGPKVETGNALNSIFGLGHDPSKALAVVRKYEGPSSVHGFAKKPKSSEKVARTQYGDRPRTPDFTKAAQAALPSGKLPDLTNAYLEKLIGWHREYADRNPNESLETVWVKNDLGVLTPSSMENWTAINQSIVDRERNVETDAKDLQSHIKGMRVKLMPGSLNRLLEWYEEKTGHQHQDDDKTVWLKNKDGETWDVAPYRWSEIRQEFSHAEVRALMRVETFDQFKKKYTTAKLNSDIAAQASPLQSPKNG